MNGINWSSWKNVFVPWHITSNGSELQSALKIYTRRCFAVIKLTSYGKSRKHENNLTSLRGEDRRVAESMVLRRWATCALCIIFFSFWWSFLKLLGSVSELWNIINIASSLIRYFAAAWNFIAREIDCYIMKNEMINIFRARLEFMNLEYAEHTDGVRRRLVSLVAIRYVFWLLNLRRFLQPKEVKS